MGLKRRGEKTEGKDLPKIPNLENGGEYEGRLVYVADLGLHEREYMGEKKPDVQKIALGIEIIGETVELEDGTVPRLLWVKPFNIYWKMSDKGAEFGYYKVFEPSAVADTVADWELQLGKCCSVTITHVKDKKDPSVVYDNIQNIVGIPAKYQKNIGAATIEPCVGDADDEDNPATKALYGLSRWMYDQRIVEGDTQEDSGFDPDDEIPF